MWIGCFVFHRGIKVIQVWKKMMMCKWWHHFLYWVYCPFKLKLWGIAYKLIKITWQVNRCCKMCFTLHIFNPVKKAGNLLRAKHELREKLRKLVLCKMIRGISPQGHFTCANWLIISLLFFDLLSHTLFCNQTEMKKKEFLFSCVFLFDHLFKLRLCLFLWFFTKARYISMKFCSPIRASKLWSATQRLCLVCPRSVHLLSIQKQIYEFRKCWFLKHTFVGFLI